MGVAKSAIVQLRTWKSLDVNEETTDKPSKKLRVLNIYVCLRALSNKENSHFRNGTLENNVKKTFQNYRFMMSRY